MHESHQDGADTVTINDHTAQVKHRTVSYSDISVLSNDLLRLSSSRDLGHQNPAYQVGESSSRSDAEGQFEIILSPDTLQGLCFETSV